MPAGMRQSYLLDNITYYLYTTYGVHIRRRSAYAHTHWGANIHRHTSTTALLHSASSSLGIVL
jgi:hypothetical protein